MVLRLGAAGADSVGVAARPWGGAARRLAVTRRGSRQESQDQFLELLRLWMARGASSALAAASVRAKSADFDEIAEMSRQRLRRGSTSFARAAQLFPPTLRASAFMLYAWCRHCDDEIDGQILGAASVAGAARSPLVVAEAERKLAGLRNETLAALAGTAVEPVFIGLQRVVEAHQIPARYPLDLIEGMAMDVRGRRYATIDDTLNYAYYVAGVVGVMMATIMGVRDRATLERASDLGIAFQLTNIARDVINDAAQGRVYLPQDWLLQNGVPAHEVGEPRHRRAVFRTTARLLDVADDYYASAAIGIGRLPFRSAWAIASARRVYRGIGDIVRERKDSAWDQRARTGSLSQLRGIALASVEAAGLIASRGSREPKPRVGLWTPSHLWST
jgi:phytoene synthase